MLRTRIKNLIKHISDDQTFFDGNAFLNDPYHDQADGFMGVTDEFQNYFFVQLKPSVEPDEYEMDQVEDVGIGDQVSRTELIFVAGTILNLDFEKAVASWINSMKSFPDFEILVDSVSTNPENIYQKLYKKPWGWNDATLTMISFTVGFHVSDINCNDYCLDGC